MKAINVLRAAKKAYSGVSDEELYYTTKAVTFVGICGSELHYGPEQQISEGVIELAACTMMDDATEERFWKHLAQLEARP